MKHLKRFEGFSMRRELCDRCKQPTNGMTTMSWLNDDVICIPCSEEEKNEPDYKLAKEKEIEQVRKGNLNYGGLWNEQD